MVKKTYNPFKMWGSYVGLVLPFLFFFIWGMKLLIVDCNFNFGSCGETQLGIIFSFILAVIGAIVGFLIGWIIHALIRGLRK